MDEEVDLEEIEQIVRKIKCNLEKQNHIFGKEDLQKILKRADELRLSPEIQDELSEKDDTSYSFEVVNKMHVKVLREFGVDESGMEQALQEVYTTRYRFQNDLDMQKFMANLLHVKYDLTGEGPINAGDELHDVVLHNFDESPKSLTQFMTNNRPLVVFAGSWT